MTAAALPEIEKVRTWVRQAQRLVVLTGAGMSAESGVPTFRDAQTGYWAQFDPLQMASEAGFRAHPARVWDWYAQRRAALAGVQPHAGHRALATFAQRHPGRLTLVTQNVDTLLDRAGAQGVIHMHGRLDSALCAACGHRWEAPAVMPPRLPCPACGRPAARPDIVWFGEMPYHMDRIEAALENADMFAAIGTSGQVYPAAGFVDLAAAMGAETVELNLDPTAPGRFERTIAGPAGTTVPAWVDSLIGPQP